MAGLSANQKKTFGAVIPVMLGIPDSEAKYVEQAVKRLDQYISALGEEPGKKVAQLLDAVRLYCQARLFGTDPEDASREDLERVCKELVDADGTAIDTVIDFVQDIFGEDLVPSVRDMSKSLREMCALAFYTNPKAADLVGWEPAWKQKRITDVVGPIVPPAPDIDVAAIKAKHAQGAQQPGPQLFANDGKKKVAIIGSGAGGAVAAAALAATGKYDVAVFEAGPRMRPSEYPWDYLAGMALMLEDGMLTLNKNLDIHLFRGRLFGGSTVLTSGMTVETPGSVLGHWQQSAGIDPQAMRDALSSVETRLRIREVHPELLSDSGELWGKGADDLPQVIVERPKANVATHPGHGAGLNIPDQKGDRCLACNMCNLGCHWGHHLAMDVTYLLDAEKNGAKIHCNTPVERLTASVEPQTGRVKVDGIVLGTAKNGPVVPVDYVVLAAGATGSPALLLRSIEADATFRQLDPVKHDRIGTGFGFNYGTTVVARFPAGKIEKPMHRGIIINYIGRKEGDPSFVLENAGVPAGLLATIVPGHGAQHKDWIRSYKDLGMAVNTIGSPQSGRVTAKQEVYYRVTPSEMDTIRKSLAIIIKMYLKGGAKLVGLAGVRNTNDTLSLFDPKWKDAPEAKIDERLRNALPTAEHIMLSSAHPQGGLRMHPDPKRGAVDADFRVHGTLNLFAADASVFPSTIVVNPQWTVNAVGQVAAGKIDQLITAASG